MATPPAKIDYRLLGFVLAFTAMACSFVLLADIYGSDSAVTQMVAVLSPFGAAIVLLFKQGETVQKVAAVEEKTDEQSKTLDRVDQAVNGKMTDRLNRIDRDVSDLKAGQAAILARLPPPPE